jgi:hypothetical protein
MSDAVTKVVPVPATITATGATGPLLADSDVDSLVITITASAASGTTPSITFSAEWAVQGTDEDNPSWASGTIVSASALTGAGTKTITLPPNINASGEPSQWWRLTWTVTGTTPSFTISVSTATG